MSYSFSTTESAGPDGIVNLSIPAEPNRSYQVFVQLVARPEKDELIERDERGWPKGFFETLPGSWVGEFPQDYEGDYEKRLEF